MARIPKKVIEQFKRSVPKFQRVLQIAKDRDVNESDTVSILQDIFSKVFGYDKYVEITSEFAIRSTYCDLSLKVADKVEFLVEAKAIGIELKEKHIRQAINYGANHGIQWVVLTNGIEWRVYRIRFEQPINYDIVCSFEFTALNPRHEKAQECLFLLAKEGLDRNAREEYYEKVKSVNRFVIAQMMLSDPFLSVVRRELKKFSEGVKIDLGEIEQIIRNEVLKRELIDGEEAEAAQVRVAKYYKKKGAKRQRGGGRGKPKKPEGAEESVAITDRPSQGDEDRSR